MEKYILTAGRIHAYAGRLRADERAEATIEKYLHDVRDFASWLAEGGTVTRESAIQWKDRLLEQGLSPSTVNARLSAVNGLFRFLGWDECRVKFLKVQRRSFRASSRELSRAEYLRLLDTAERQGRTGLSLLLETICSTGIRVSELRYITVEAAKSGAAEVFLKGKIRTILLPAKLCRKLLKYAGKQKNASGEIFLSESGTSLSRCRIWREMKALCAAAGVSASKVFPHNLRHLFAAEFYRATRDLVKLADVMGHSSVNTTRIYLLATGREHARIMERLRLVT